MIDAASILTADSPPIEATCASCVLTWPTNGASALFNQLENVDQSIQFNFWPGFATQSGSRTANFDEDPWVDGSGLQSDVSNTDSSNPLIGETSVWLNSGLRWEGQLTHTIVSGPGSMHSVQDALTANPLLELLAKAVYGPEGLAFFLNSPQARFEGRAAVDLIQNGQIDAVVGALVEDHDGLGY